MLPSYYIILSIDSSSFDECNASIHGGRTVIPAAAPASAWE